VRLPKRRTWGARWRGARLAGASGSAAHPRRRGGCSRTAGRRGCHTRPTRRPLAPPLAAAAGFVVFVARLLHAGLGQRSVPGRVLIAISSLSIPAIFGRHSSITSTGATTTYSRTSVALPRTPPSSSPAGIDRFSAGRRSPAAGPDCPHVDGLLPVLLRPDRPPGYIGLGSHMAMNLITAGYKVTIHDMASKVARQIDLYSVKFVC